VRASVAAILGSAALIGFSSQVIAAEADEADEDEVELEEVQVTGTRIQNPNAVSANPITSISGEEMRALGIVNIADALTQLVPQNVSTWTDYAVSDLRGGPNMAEDGADRGQYFIGNTIANLRGLDPAFGSRTLTLVDGRRMVSTSSQADVVDLNIIPSNLLQRMDVVTGGASATYGSGAVSGVVNLVLNNRMTGINLDMDYGINEAGDGKSPHVSISGGTPLFGGRAHVLVGAEWQKTDPIQSCAQARDWCNDSRTLFVNSSNNLDTADPLEPLSGTRAGYSGYPGRFELDNMRYNQFSENGAIIVSNQVNATTAYRFTADGTGVEEYALGFRGGVGATGGNSQVVNGDGPPITDGTSMRSQNERRTLFTNFEFNFSERTTGYIQANYAKTEGVNRNTYTTSTNCVKFGTQGVGEIAGFETTAGQVIPFTEDFEADYWASASFRNFYGMTASPYGFFPGLGGSFASPYWVAGGTPAIPGTSPPPTTPPSFSFGGNAVGNWALEVAGDGNWWWTLQSITILTGGSDPGTPAILPAAQGRDSNAFLGNLSPEALEQLQRGFNNATTTGNGGFASYLFGNNPCSGFTAIKKVWSPQFRRFSTNDSETMGATVGIKGRYGSDWRWDAYVQYGQTDSASSQNNAATNIRQAFASDSVIDDRVGSPTFGQPICRVTRDGVPVLDASGRPTGDIDAIEALAEGCQPLNVFGSVFNDPAAAAMQQAAIDYAFIQNNSEGDNSLMSVAVNTNGTLWDGIGAGPLTGAFGLEYRKDKVDNSGSLGNYYERYDIASGWSDKFGGSTSQAEGFFELNMPLVAGLEAVNLWSVSAAVRFNQIKNKGGAGTSGGSLTQDTTNWKLSTVFEPFDWVRLRLTRSRDLRAPGYRDLFIQQQTPGGPNYLGQENPWRERTAASTENQQERVGTVTVGNPALQPETSNTLTFGVVLSPGGWAQGMRLSADYYDISVKGGFFTSYANSNPIEACWEQSGNQYPVEGDPSSQYIFDQFNENVPSCQRITFAELKDLNGNPIPGSRDLSDIVWYELAKPENGLPYQRRGVDLTLNYNFPLNRAFESLPGSVALTVRGQRALESSGAEAIFCFAGTEGCNAGPAGTGYLANPRIYQMVGQLRSANYIPGVTPSPKWSGNITATYMMGDFTASLSTRYTGGAKIDNTWQVEGDPNYMNEEGQLLNGSVDRNFVKAYYNFSLNGSYNLKVGDLRQFQVFGSINNLFDKDPPWSAGYLSGVNPQYHDTMGRAYRMGVRLKF
jgi:outer membrane receptor protein involved in Fe transport